MFLRKFCRAPTVVYVHQPGKGAASRSAGLSGAIWRSSELKQETLNKTSNSEKLLFKSIMDYQDVAVAQEDTTNASDPTMNS